MIWGIFAALNLLFEVFQFYINITSKRDFIEMFLMHQMGSFSEKCRPFIKDFYMKINLNEFVILLKVKICLLYTDVNTFD